MVEEGREVAAETQHFQPSPYFLHLFALYQIVTGRLQPRDTTEVSAHRSPQTPPPAASDHHRRHPPRRRPQRRRHPMATKILLACLFSLLFAASVLAQTVTTIDA